MIRANFPPDYGRAAPEPESLGTYRYLEENFRKACILVEPTMTRINDKQLGYHANLALNHLKEVLFLLEARNGNGHD